MPEGASRRSCRNSSIGRRGPNRCSSGEPASRRAPPERPMTFAWPLALLLLVPLLSIAVLLERRLVGRRGARAGRVTVRLALLTALVLALAGPSLAVPARFAERWVVALDAAAARVGGAEDAAADVAEFRARARGKETSELGFSDRAAAGLLAARALFRAGEGGRIL